MQHKRFLGLAPALMMVLALASIPGTVQAQSAYDFTIGVMGTIGGATDGEPDSGLGNLGLQLLFAMDKDSHTRFSARLGSLDLDTDDLGDIFQTNPFDAKLTYLTLSGEYMVTEPSYESGVFLGIGLYEVTDAPVFDANGFFSSDDESTIGLTLGATGDFKVGDHWSVLGEISGHYADLDYGRFFVMGHVGIGFHF